MLKSTHEYQDISINSLVPFPEHPFKTYEGQRFKDMAESVRANGVHTPIIVRPTTDDKYEILSGHNRAAAAKDAEHTTIPAIVRKGLTDEEALLVVTETNLIQRSFADMSHSERSVVLTAHYRAIAKKSGYRRDLIDEIQELIDPTPRRKTKDKSSGQTCAPSGRRLDTRDKLGEQYCLSKNTIARYLRVDKLIPELKERLDTDGIGMRVAEALSYLDKREQIIADKRLSEGQKISMKQAEKLKKVRKKTSTLVEADFDSILAEKPASTDKPKPKVFNSEVLAKYFSSEQSEDEIKKAVKEAVYHFLNNRR